MSQTQTGGWRWKTVPAAERAKPVSSYAPRDFPVPPDLDNLATEIERCMLRDRHRLRRRLQRSQGARPETARP